MGLFWFCSGFFFLGISCRCLFFGGEGEGDGWDMVDCFFSVFVMFIISLFLLELIWSCIFFIRVFFFVLCVLLLLCLLVLMFVFFFV